MSDEPDKQGQGAPSGDPKPSAETPAAGSQPEMKQEPAKPEGGQDPEKKEPSAPSGEPEKPASPQPEHKPVSRRSAQYRIQQLADDNRRLKEENERLKTGKPAGDDGGDPKPDEPKQPEISKQVSEEVNRRLEPVLKEHSKAADDAEISDLFADDLKDRKAEYEPRIRKAWELEQYKDLAASDVFKILDYDQAIARARTEAVEEFKKAEKEAKESSGSGTTDTSNRSGKGKSVDQMTDDELIAHNERVKAGQA